MRRHALAKQHISATRVSGLNDAALAESALCWLKTNFSSQYLAPLWAADVLGFASLLNHAYSKELILFVSV